MSSASSTWTTGATSRCPATSGPAPTGRGPVPAVLDRRPPPRAGVDVHWSPQALAEAGASRRDGEARTAITLVVPRLGDGDLPTGRDVLALRRVGLVAIDVCDDVDFAGARG